MTLRLDPRKSHVPKLAGSPRTTKGFRSSSDVKQKCHTEGPPLDFRNVYYTDVYVILQESPAPPVKAGCHVSPT